MAWIAGWKYRKKIRLNYHQEISSDLTDFPTVVHLDSTNFDFTKSNSDGRDIRITASDGTTEYSFEREVHDSTNETARYHVKIPTVSGSTYTDIWIYYTDLVTYQASYTSESGAFTVGERISGGTSNASAIVLLEDTSNDILYLRDIVGTFVAEVITGDDSESSATISAAPTATDYEDATNVWGSKYRAVLHMGSETGDENLRYLSAGSVFQVGETITGDVSGATANITAINTSWQYLYLDNVVGTFDASDTITGSITAETDTIIEINTGTVLDSTSNDLDFSKLGSSNPIQTLDEMGYGQVFSGTDNKLIRKIEDDPGNDVPYSMQILYRCDGATATFRRIQAGGSVRYMFAPAISGGGANLVLIAKGVTGTNYATTLTATIGTWHNKYILLGIQVNYASNELYYYVDGVKVGTHDITAENRFYNGFDTWTLGTSSTFSNDLDGNLSEYQYTHTLEDNNFFKATYLSIFSKKIVYDIEENKPYLDKLNNISRSPQTLCVITLDECENVYGESPCRANKASGSECYNTYHTCQDHLNYVRGSKDYKFSLQEANLPIIGYRPYMGAVKYMATEIKPNKITVKARVKATMFDEDDGDVGIDPYYATRSSIQGTFWKKLVARTPNYNGRRVKFYEGFDGLLESEFVPKFVGLLDNITVNKSSIEIEAIDLLNSLKKIKVPTKITSKLKHDINATTTTIAITSVTGLDETNGYIRIDEEIIFYTSIADNTNILQGVVRNMFSTVSETDAIEEWDGDLEENVDVDGHKEEAKVEKVEYFPIANPYDMLVSMLTVDAEIDRSDIDIAAFETLANDDPVFEIGRSALVTKSITLEKLFFELVNELDCKVWVNEDLKITIKKNMYNKPGSSYHTISDTANMIDTKTKVDYNEESRFSRIVVYWGKDVLGELEDKNSYSNIDIFIDADAESDNEFDESKEKIFFSRWISVDTLNTEEERTRYIINNFSRILYNTRDAQKIVDFSVELKDLDIKTGDFVKMTSGEIQQVDGSDISARVFQITKRQKKKDIIRLKSIETPSRRISFISNLDDVTYDIATDEQKEYGFIAEGDYLEYTSSSGKFVGGETVTGGTSGATAIVAYDEEDDDKIYIYTIVGTFEAETITGDESGFTAIINDNYRSSNLMANGDDGYRIF